MWCAVRVATGKRVSKDAVVSCLSMCSLCDALPDKLQRTSKYDDGRPPDSFPAQYALFEVLREPAWMTSGVLRCRECGQYYQRVEYERSLMGGPDFDVETIYTKISEERARVLLDAK